MIDTAAMGQAMDLLSAQWAPWLLIVPGLLLGLLAGAVPGFGPGAMFAIMLPVAYHLDFLSAMIFMTSIFTGSGFGVAIPAILINVPGSAASVATTFDGFPMTRQGRQNEALGLALAASCFGTAVSYVILLAFIDNLAGAVLALGPAEMLLVVFWGLSLIAVMGGDLLKGLMAGMTGLLLATIGFGLMGTERGTLGIPHLLDGVSSISAMVGLFAVSEMFRLMHTDYVVEGSKPAPLEFRRILDGVRLAFRYPVTLLRGSAIGAMIGLLPGVGASLSNLFSYDWARRAAPDPDRFGQGAPEGVVAAESANSSSEGGSMLTLLALGIPGGAGTAMLYTVFALNDITGGPRFYAENKDVVYAIVLNNIVQAGALFVVGLACVHLFSALVRAPTRYLVPGVLAVSISASYAVTGSMIGPITALVFGVLGWMMDRHGYSRPALVVGLLLGDQLEAEALRTFQISGGSFDYLLGRPIALVLLVLLLATFLRAAMRRRRATGAAAR
ncbi:MAG: tripartite tricarboxylate transporter permease [Pseudooceanicola sp.]|nr:tripartite tricarboxylate transporter permease [Pseudooceanicola sp.]